MLLMIYWRACGGLQPVLVHCCKTLLVLMIKIMMALACLA
jgi:hypothetical protein